MGVAKAVRMSDIAERLHISTVTVSKALAGKDGVSETLRKEILHLAEEMGYEGKKQKAEPASGYTVGIIASHRYIEKGHSFYWTLYERVLHSLSQAGHIGILEVVSEEEEHTLYLPRLLQDKRVNCLIMMGNFASAYYKMIEEQKVPFVMLDAMDASLQHDAIISDGYYGMYTMVNYLLRMGHREIVYVGSIQQTSSILDRYYGYCRAMQEAGIPVTADHVLPDRDDMGLISLSLAGLTTMPTAFACNCDVAAYALLNELKKHDISVPEMVSVIGFDDFIYSRLAVPPITTYAVDINQMSEKCVTQLLWRMTHPEEATQHIVVSGRPLFRESVRNLKIGSQS